MNKLLEAFPITLPDGRAFLGRLYATYRSGGRRITVSNRERVLYDTDSCYDLGNATNKLEHWLQGQIAKAAAE